MHCHLTMCPTLPPPPKKKKKREAIDRTSLSHQPCKIAAGNNPGRKDQSSTSHIQPVTCRKRPLLLLAKDTEKHFLDADIGRKCKFNTLAWVELPTWSQQIPFRTQHERVSVLVLWAFLLLSLFLKVMEKSQRGNGRCHIRDTEGFTRRIGQFACKWICSLGAMCTQKKKNEVEIWQTWSSMI